MSDLKRYFVTTTEAGVNEAGKTAEKAVGQYDAAKQAIAFGVPAEQVLSRKQRRRERSGKNRIVVGAGLGDTTDRNQIAK